MKRPIDHVVFAGRDLDVLQESFEAAGFETAYGGTHSNGITHMHLIGFGNRSYIELISKNDPNGTAPWWNEQIDSDAGATAWSITVDDIAARSEELAAEGIDIEGPTKFSRDRPDGKSVEWELTIVGGRPQGTPLPMLEMDHTPLEWRVDITTDPKTTGIMGLTDVVIGTDRFDETVEAFEEFYDGAEAEIRREEAFGARVASIGGTAATIAEPLEDDSWLAERIDRHDALLPCAFLVEATDVDALEEQFEIDEQTAWGDDTVYWFDVDIDGRFGSIDRS
ncbi:MAG: VOC family protein [Halobacteriota archaeon]|uniref:VOC family protein n=1 Tax=Natronomonas sp. TaxID=2184060 RepID=UPI003975EF81